MAKQPAGKASEKPEPQKTIEELQIEEHIKNLDFALRIAGVRTDPGVLQVLIYCDRLVQEKGKNITVQEILDVVDKYGQKPEVRPGGQGNPNLAPDPNQRDNR